MEESDCSLPVCCWLLSFQVTQSNEIIAMLIISSNTRSRLVLFVLLISFFTADGDDPGDSPKIEVMVIKDSHQMLSSGKHLRILPSTTVSY